MHVYLTEKYQIFRSHCDDRHSVEMGEQRKNRVFKERELRENRTVEVTWLKVNQEWHQQKRERGLRKPWPPDPLHCIFWKSGCHARVYRWPPQSSLRPCPGPQFSLAMCNDSRRRRSYWRGSFFFPVIVSNMTGFSQSMWRSQCCLCAEIPECFQSPRWAALPCSFPRMSIMYYVFCICIMYFVLCNNHVD